MNEHYPPALVDATADDVLAILRDMHRQQCMHDPMADSTVSLSHDSTIAEWRWACDLLPWAQVAQGMNANWQVSIPMEHWRDVLEPAKSRQLRGVCDLVAQYASAPRVRPANILGSNCVSAGAFLTVRTYLAEAGADVLAVGPSTPLCEYTRRYAAVFLGPVSQLAPGALPLVKIRTPVYHTFIVSMLVAWIGMIVAWCVGAISLGILSVLVFGVCYLGVWTVGRRLLPASVEFPGLRTFRDLAKTIAAGERTQH